LGETVLVEAWNCLSFPVEAPVAQLALPVEWVPEPE
jgi:hypothetical protein